MRTLGELTLRELLETADAEMSGLNALVERLGDGDVTALAHQDKLLLRAYVGSVWSRLALARGKLEELAGAAGLALAGHNLVISEAVQLRNRVEKETQCRD